MDHKTALWGMIAGFFLAMAMILAIEAFGEGLPPTVGYILGTTTQVIIYQDTKLTEDADQFAKRVACPLLYELAKTGSKIYFPVIYTIRFMMPDREGFIPDMSLDRHGQIQTCAGMKA